MSMDSLRAPNINLLVVGRYFESEFDPEDAEAALKIVELSGLGAEKKVATALVIAHQLDKLDTTIAILGGAAESFADDQAASRRAAVVELVDNTIYPDIFGHESPELLLASNIPVEIPQSFDLMDQHLSPATRLN